MTRSYNIRPVNRIKHVVDIQVAVPVNTQIANVISLTKDAPSLGTANETETGSRINGMFLSVEAVASETSTTATPNAYLSVWKNPGNNITLPNGNAVGVDDNKRFCVHQEMVMINPLDGGSPRNLFKGVIKFPRGYARNGPNDRWIVALFTPSTGVAFNACMQAHYKEFR